MALFGKTIRLLSLGGYVVGVWPQRWLWQLFGPRAQSSNRSQWLRAAASWGLRALGVQVQCYGSLPKQALVVANHLGYADVLALAAAMPCRFVAKAEVRRWPIFGGLAVEAQSLFVERHRKTLSHQHVAQLVQALEEGPPVVIFPEGTSTDGSTVRPFRTSLFEAAVQAKVPVVPVAIRYFGPDGRRDNHLPFYGDDNLATHLVRSALAPSVTIDLRIRRPIYGNDRKMLAKAAFEEIYGIVNSQRSQPN